MRSCSMSSMQLGLREQLGEADDEGPASWWRTTGMNWTMMKNWCARPSSMLPASTTTGAMLLKAHVPESVCRHRGAAWMSCWREWGASPEGHALALPCALITLSHRAGR